MATAHERELNLKSERIAELEAELAAAYTSIGDLRNDAQSNKEMITLYKKNMADRDEIQRTNEEMQTAVTTGQGIRATMEAAFAVENQKLQGDVKHAQGAEQSMRKQLEAAEVKLGRVGMKEAQEAAVVAAALGSELRQADEQIAHAHHLLELQRHAAKGLGIVYLSQLFPLKRELRRIAHQQALDTKAIIDLPFKYRMCMLQRDQIQAALAKLEAEMGPLRTQVRLKTDLESLPSSTHLLLSSELETEAETLPPRPPTRRPLKKSLVRLSTWQLLLEEGSHRALSEQFVTTSASLDAQSARVGELEAQVAHLVAQLATAEVESRRLTSRLVDAKREHHASQRQASAHASHAHDALEAAEAMSAEVGTYAASFGPLVSRGHSPPKLPPSSASTSPPKLVPSASAFSRPSTPANAVMSTILSTGAAPLGLGSSVGDFSISAARGSAVATASSSHTEVSKASRSPGGFSPPTGIVLETHMQARVRSFVTPAPSRPPTAEALQPAPLSLPIGLFPSASSPALSVAGGKAWAPEQASPTAGYLPAWKVSKVGSPRRSPLSRPTSRQGSRPLSCEHRVAVPGRARPAIGLAAVPGSGFLRGTRLSPEQFNELVGRI